MSLRQQREIDNLRERVAALEEAIAKKPGRPKKVETKDAA